MRYLGHSRRDVLQTSVGLAGLTVPTFLRARAASAAESTTAAAKAGSPAGRAKACIIVYCWGGISHYESWDPKPEAPADLRGEFGTIETSVPGVRFCEHLPLLAEHADKVTLLRSVHHKDGGHGGALYTNMTGHAPAGKPAKDRANSPSLTSVVARFRPSDAGTPNAVRLPHSMYDNGTLIPGQFGGWLGSNYDPVLIPTPAGRPFGGTSRVSGSELNLALTLERDRIRQRRTLLERLDRVERRSVYDNLDRFQKMAADLLLESPFSEAYDLEREDPRIRQMYGPHMGGQGLLLARRLVEAGVPVVQVCAGAGDLAGGSGDNWDTHRDHFTKLKKRLMPVFDRSLAALIADLDQRGMLEETLVVLLTDFGRTPKINKNAGRDHYPAVYSLLMAGGGVRGGHVHGSSDPGGRKPANAPCTPADVHATAYRALGIDHHAELQDEFGRPFRLCLGTPLPVF